MLIHAYRRTAKTAVELFGLALMFEPNAAGHVVCEVEDERATERLLEISEAYKPYDPETAGNAAAPAPAPVAPPPAPPQTNTDPDEDDDENKAFTAVLLGSEGLPESYEVGEHKVSLAEVIDLAFTRSGMTREAWNLNDLDDREALIEGEVTRMRLADEKAKADAQAAADAAAAAAAPAPAPAADSLVLEGPDGTKIDLGAMSGPKLREFAKAQGITLPGGNSTKVDELRLMVKKALTGQ